MLKSILVPLDGSRFSEQALPVARSIARKHSAELHLVSVHEPLPVGAGAEFEPGLDTGVREWQRKYLAEVARRIGEEDGVAPASALLDGKAAPELTAYAREAGVGLIVMTTHGRSGLNRAWLGSVADRTVRESRVPVMLLRPKSEEAAGEAGEVRFARILVPLDGSELAEQALRPATEVGDPDDAEYVVLRVVHPTFTIGSPYLPHTVQEDEERQAERNAEATAYLRAVADRLTAESDRTVHVTVVLKSGAAGSILRIAEEEAVDLIAMATHGRGGVTRAVLGSTADKVLRGTDRPVLLYRPRAD